jgi:hypothetical protein
MRRAWARRGAVTSYIGKDFGDTKEDFGGQVAERKEGKKGKKEKKNDCQKTELEGTKETTHTSPSFARAHSILAGRSMRSDRTGMKCSNGTSHGVKNSAKAVDCARGRER